MNDYLLFIALKIRHIDLNSYLKSLIISYLCSYMDLIIFVTSYHCFDLIVNLKLIFWNVYFLSFDLLADFHFCYCLSIF